MLLVMVRMMVLLTDGDYTDADEGIIRSWLRIRRERAESMALVKRLMSDRKAEHARYIWVQGFLRHLVMTCRIDVSLHDTLNIELLREAASSQGVYERRLLGLKHLSSTFISDRLLESRAMLEELKHMYRRIGADIKRVGVDISAGRDLSI